MAVSSEPCITENSKYYYFWEKHLCNSTVYEYLAPVAYFSWVYPGLPVFDSDNVWDDLAS